MKERILIVEDDKHISKLIKFNLEKANYECVAAATGEKALAALGNQPFDLIMLDLMLPGMDGFEVCRAIRQTEKTRGIPVIMLTAKSAETDRIVGLELGADDYIVKPFSPRELILRIKAVLKRGRIDEVKKDMLCIWDVVIDIPRHRVTVKGKTIELTQMEFKLLTTLIERRGRVQTRERLLSDVWNLDSAIDTRTIDTHIKRIRKKLGRSGVAIETVRGMGYRVSEEDAP